MLKSELALLKCEPICVIITDVNPVIVKSKCSNCLLRLMTVPNNYTISNWCFSVSPISQRLFQPKLMYYNFRFSAITFSKRCAYFGSNLFQLISKQTSLLALSITCSRCGIHCSLSCTETRLNCESWHDRNCSSNCSVSRQPILHWMMWSWSRWSGRRRWASCAIAVTQ